MADRHDTSWIRAVIALAVSGAGCISGSSGGGTGTDASASDAAPVDVARDASKPPPDVAQPVDVAAPADVARDAVAADAQPADAGCGMVWPSCDAPPAGATPATIAELWTANAMRPTFQWVSGAVVTAVSRGACTAGTACQFYVQEPTAATTLAEVAHHAVKVFVSAAASSRFVGIRVGDRVDIAAYAWRYNVTGQNELLLQVADSCSLRGCMRRTGDGTIAPVTATLDALGSVTAYEYTYGPVLVRLDGVSATTDMMSALDSTTGGLFVPTRPTDAGLTGEPISISPFFLPGSRFVGFTNGQRLRFSSLVGVFGMFIPSAPAADGGVTKYLQIYPRTTADLTLMM